MTKKFCAGLGTSSPGQGQGPRNVRIFSPRDHPGYDHFGVEFA
jgi:hypothetical protein